MSNKMKVNVSIPSITHRTTIELDKKQVLKLLSFLTEMTLGGLDEEPQEPVRNRRVSSVEDTGYIRKVVSGYPPTKGEVEYVEDDYMGEYDDYRGDGSNDMPTMSELLDDINREDNPFETDGFFQRDRLVTFKCSHCGTISSQFKTLADTNVLPCHYCKGDNVIHKVDRADTECNLCKDSMFFYPANDLMYTECRRCKTQINLLPNSLGELVSANLVK